MTSPAASRRTTTAAASSGSTRHRRGRDALHRVRRPGRCAGPNDIVFDAPRRLLLHRPRQDRDTEMDNGAIYYATADGRPDQAGGVPAGPSQRLRPLPRRCAPLRPRRSRAGSGTGTSSPRAWPSPGQCSARRRHACCTPSGGYELLDSWPSTPRATCASATLSPVRDRDHAPTGELKDQIEVPESTRW